MQSQYNPKHRHRVYFMDMHFRKEFGNTLVALGHCVVCDIRLKRILNSNLSYTAVLSAKFQNGWTTDMSVRKSS